MLKFATINVLAIATAIMIVLLHFFIETTLWYLLGIVLIWFVFTASGSGLIQWNYHLISLNSNPKTIKNQIAITFDDGPHPEFTLKTLMLLAKYNQKATFFCIGKNIVQFPNVFNQIIAEGHTVGNHTYNHAHNFGILKTKEVLSELRETTAIAYNASGLKMKLYRPAFGVTNPRIKRAVAELKLQSIGWNKRSLDTTNRSEKVILKRITNNLKKGDVVLLHDSSEKSLKVLEQLLIFLKQKKIASVTIDQLFKIKAYA